MRIKPMIFLLFLCFFVGQVYSQCLNTLVENSFNFECIQGDPNGARIGLDSVLYTAIGTGTVEVAPSGIFGSFKNGNYSESFSYDVGDVIKIKPISNGLGGITLVSQEPCGIDIFYAKTVCTISLPVIWITSPIAKLCNINQTQITWSIASQLNNEKYIIEHSNPDSYRGALNFSPIGEIAGDGTNNETKQYEYIHTSPSIGMNYYRIHPVG